MPALIEFDVYNNRPTYCNWVLETAEHGEKPSKELQGFAEYLLFMAPVAPPTGIQMQRGNHHRLNPASSVGGPANEVVFPDTDWHMTDEEQRATDEAQNQPRRSQQHCITDDYDPDL